jgi:K+ transporter
MFLKVQSKKGKEKSAESALAIFIGALGVVMGAIGTKLAIGDASLGH